MLTIYKYEGETPLQCLDRSRNEQPVYKDAVLSYAGRLDPMAEGKLLVLVGEDNKEREKYLGLDKEYEVEVLFGISTDTGDILGLVDSKFTTHSVVNFTSDILDSFVGSFKQSYPHYSSKTVKGKPLFAWAREGKIEEIEIPQRDAEVYEITLLENRTIRDSEIIALIKERIPKVKGDFRQKEIIKSWEMIIKGKEQATFECIKIKVKCSSGTYMRSLAEEIGRKRKMPALAWSIKRTQILDI